MEGCLSHPPRCEEAPARSLVGMSFSSCFYAFVWVPREDLTIQDGSLDPSWGPLGKVWYWWLFWCSAGGRLVRDHHNTLLRTFIFRLRLDIAMRRSSGLFFMNWIWLSHFLLTSGLRWMLLRLVLCYSLASTVPRRFGTSWLISVSDHGRSRFTSPTFTGEGITLLIHGASGSSDNTMTYFDVASAPRYFPTLRILGYVSFSFYVL